MKIKAWHFTDKFQPAFRDASPEIITTINLGETHVLLPVTHEVDTDDSEVAVNAAFEFFNWVHAEFYAPDEVNNVCREHKAHASMSVGDIVELENGTFWYCESFGWKQIPVPLKRA